MKKRIIALLGVVLVLSSTFSGCGETINSEETAYRQYGLNCLQSGNYEEAITAFQKALDQSKGKVGPMEIDICLYKGKAQFLNGDIEEAEKTYTTVIDYNEDSGAYFSRGCLYFSQDNTEKGYADFDAAIKQDPQNYDLYIGIGDTLTKYNLQEKADEYLDKALKIESDNPDDLMQKGRIYTIKADYEKAQEYLQKAIDKKLSKANFYMGKLWVKQGDMSVADFYFKSYIDSGDATADDLYEVAKAEMEDQEYEVALEYFTAAEQKEPPVSDIQHLKKSIIICYENLRDFQKAKELMKEYVKEFPNDQDAKREMDFLETR